MYYPGQPEDLRIQRRLKEGIQSSLENNNLNTVTNAPIQRAILGDTANPGKESMF